MVTRAQAGLEYLMTYGWALIIIATIVAVTVFLLATPASKLSFRTNMPEKFLAKGGAMPFSSGSDTVIQWGVSEPGEIILTNASGTPIEITGVLIDIGDESLYNDSLEQTLNSTQGIWTEGPPGCYYSIHVGLGEINGIQAPNGLDVGPVRVASGEEIRLEGVWMVYLNMAGEGCPFSFSQMNGHHNGSIKFLVEYTDGFGLEREFEIEARNIPEAGAWS